MINLIIIILLLFGFLIGLRRGFILQLFHLLGFIVAFIVSTMYYDKISPYLELWIPYPELSGDGSWAIFFESLPLKSGFYNAISFAVIFFLTKIILQIIANMLDFVSNIPVVGFVNRILGSILGFLENYLILFILLYILALTPISSIQTRINDSSVAMFMIEKTPVLSEQIKTLWFTYIEAFMSIL